VGGGGGGNGVGEGMKVWGDGTEEGGRIVED